MNITKFFQRMKQRGQMLVLFALLIPIILLFVGLGIDIGWYYLNVSRLQNAADAAALAGSKKIVGKLENEKMNQRYYAKLLTTPPSDLKEFTEVYYSEGTTSQSLSTDYSGNMQMHSGSILDRETKSEKINMNAGKTAAKEYTVKNLSSDEDAQKNKNKIIDSWNTSPKTAGQEVTLSAKLYSTAMDFQEKRNGLRYYEVTLTENIPHFFLPGWFKPMKAIVKSYVVLKLHATDMTTSINMLEPVKVIANWEYQNKYFSYKGKWNHYRQTVGGNKRVSYKTGDDFRTETVNVHVDKNSGSGIPTSANGNKYYSEDEVDSINIDFNQDVQFSGQFTSDWDLGAAAPDGTTITYINKDGWTDDVGYDLRIQGLINLNSAWTNRNLKKIKSGNYTSDDLLPDILWTRIESDPIWSKMPWGTQYTLDSVHQMIINVNTPNTDVYTFTDSNGNEHKVYEQRPFFIFYMGPEKNVNDYSDKTFTEDTTVRKSQPVILNLNADFNGVLYAPNSPVIINGNGHTMRGFVIAKEYLKLKEDSDFTSKGYLKAFDSYGHTIFYKNGENVLSEEGLTTAKEGYTETTDSVKGIVSLYDANKKFVAQYRKITHDGTTEYLKEKSSTYYMKLVPTGSSEDNPIIVDNYGNIQVKEKPLSDSSWGMTRSTNSNEQPDDPGKYKTLQNELTTELQDYRDMSYEVVYKMQEAFNINENYPGSDNNLASGYSYFQISELERKNYTYFNVDELNKTPADKWHVVDMFFTTKRASWID